MNELQARARWLTERNEIGDGFQCGPIEGGKVVIFVIEKIKHEKHFDTFSFLLHKHCNLEQVDSNDIQNRVLEQGNIKSIIFPGGPVCDVQKVIGKEVAKSISQFIHAGGSYIGICAGAFIASADGYFGCKKGWGLLNLKTSWYPGVGTAKNEIIESKDWIMDCPNVDLYFCNGPMFSIPKKQGKNSLINKKTNPPTVIVKYVDIKTNKGSVSRNQVDSYPAAVVQGIFGNGTVICFGPHPEASGNTWSNCLVNAILSTLK